MMDNIALPQCLPWLLLTNRVLWHRSYLQQLFRLYIYMHACMICALQRSKAGIAQEHEYVYNIITHIYNELFENVYMYGKTFLFLTLFDVNCFGGSRWRKPSVCLLERFPLRVPPQWCKYLRLKPAKLWMFASVNFYNMEFAFLIYLFPEGPRLLQQVRSCKGVCHKSASFETGWVVSCVYISWVWQAIPLSGLIFISRTTTLIWPCSMLHPIWGWPKCLKQHW